MFAREPSLGTRVLFFVVLSIATMVCDVHHKMEWMRTCLSTLILPVEYAVAWPTQIVRFVVTSCTSRKALLAENAKLKAEQLLLQTDVQRLYLLQEENAQLRALLWSAPQTGSRKILVAQLLEGSADPFIHEVVLDVGKNQGVFLGQAVLDSQGVMGQIVQVNPLTSRALLITDTRSALPVQNTRTGQRGILVGDGISETLHLQHIPETANINVGDKLICSGLGGYFPPGYPVGIVKKIDKKVGDHFSVVTVTPTAHFEHHQVLLSWPDQRTEVG